MRWLICLLLFVACPLPSLAAPPAYRLIDLTGNYTSFHDRTKGMSPQERIAAFQTDVAQLFPQFYRPGRPGAPATQDEYGARIARSIERFAAIRADYERVAASFTGMLANSLEAFQRTFTDMSQIGDIYLVHSLGEMDGGMRELDGMLYFVFGADVIARIHAPGSERPFFHHELFHRYQADFFPGCEQVWCGLWQEGLAVLAAEELNPGATDAQLLLTQPQPIRPAVDANLAEAVCIATARLDSVSSDDWDALFGSARINERLPGRFGYYVGYLVAREARRTRSTQELAHLTAAQARQAVEAALAKLAPCPA